MNRRDMLAAMGALALAPTMAFAETGWVDYTPGLVKARLAAGETVFVDFSATWCTTCKSQERSIGALMGENPAYGENVTFVRVDWDDFGRGELATELAIPRRSTLVVLKGDAELGRIVAGTRKSDIQALMDVALGAATAA
ncbi:MAG: thioredoxin family protein [Pseudomonadota bacterium]